VKTEAEWGADVPPGRFGARVQALVAYCTGRLGLSHRDVVEAMSVLQCQAEKQTEGDYDTSDSSLHRSYPFSCKEDVTRNPLAESRKLFNRPLPN